MASKHQQHIDMVLKGLATTIISWTNAPDLKRLADELAALAGRALARIDELKK